MLASTSVFASLECTDQGPWPCAEAGCPASSVGCSDLRNFCPDKYRFADVFSHVPSEVNASTRIRNVCPHECGVCGTVYATFVNELRHSNASLHWLGSAVDGGPMATLGSIQAGGGQLQVARARIGHSFSIALAGTVRPLVRHVVNDGVERYSVTNEDAQRAAAANGVDESGTCELAPSCSAATSCVACVALGGCGWSVVRRRCVGAHPVATDASCDDQRPAAALSTDAWLAEAATLADPAAPGYGPRALRAAFRAVERAVEVAAPKAGASGAAAFAQALAQRDELALKLQAVFGEADARQLLEATRFPSLAAVHPEMPMVPRRGVAEAREYIARAEPVVITGLFAQREGAAEACEAEAAHPVVHKWTLEYLAREFAGAGTVDAPFNVAADARRSCCRYYESRHAAVAAGFPYPFRPRTRLYRDTFNGFVATLRHAALNRSRAVASGASAAEADASAPTLHYLHDLMMDTGGKPVAGRSGAAAPPKLAAELNATAAALLPLARLQPFYGGIANAKVWIGQRGVTMPLHYDSTDNLYVSSLESQE